MYEPCLGCHRDETAREEPETSRHELCFGGPRTVKTFNRGDASLMEWERGDIKLGKVNHDEKIENPLLRNTNRAHI